MCCIHCLISRELLLSAALYINGFEVIVGPVFHLHAEPMTEWNRSALICLRGDLNLNVNLKGSGMLPMLAIESPQGFLNQYEMRNIKALSNEMDQMDKIIDFLLGKEDNCFSKFCDSLIKSGNRTWGEQLKMKAEEFKRGSGKVFIHCPCTKKYMSCEHFYIVYVWLFMYMVNYIDFYIPDIFIQGIYVHRVYLYTCML